MKGGAVVVTKTGGRLALTIRTLGPRRWKHLHFSRTLRRRGMRESNRETGPLHSFHTFCHQPAEFLRPLHSRRSGRTYSQGMGTDRLPTRLVDLCVHGPLCGSWRSAGEMGGSREASADTRLGSRCLESPHRRIRNRLELWLAVCRASGSRRRGGGLRSGVQLAYRRFVSRCPARPRPRVLHARASIGRFSRNLRERTCGSSIWLAHGFLPRLRSRAASYDTHSAVA